RVSDHHDLDPDDAGARREPRVAARVRGAGDRAVSGDDRDAAAEGQVLNFDFLICDANKKVKNQDLTLYGCGLYVPCVGEVGLTTSTLFRTRSMAICCAVNVPFGAVAVAGLPNT